MVNTCGNSRSPRHARGFTIVELMITIIIAALLVALALPSFRELMMRNTVTTTTNAMIYSLNLARVEAVRRGVAVRVISNGSSSSWDAGWQVQADVNGDGTFATTALVGQQNAVPSTYSVCGSSSGGTGNNLTVTFTPIGAMAKNVSTFDFNINRPDGKATNAKRITVQASGEIITRTNTTGSPALTNC